MRIVAAGGADITITSPLQAAGADALTNSTSGIPTYDLLSGYNGATWDRLRALGDDSDGVATASLGRFLALARLSGFNGSTWDRLLSEGNDRDAIANTTLGNLQTLGFQHVYNGASWDRQLAEGTDRDAIAAATSGYLQSIGFGHIYNGSTWDRHRSLGATALLGLGQAAVSLGIPGASTVKGFVTDSDPGETRTTIITPASGKKIRILNVSWGQRNGSASTYVWVYFGLGARPETTPANIISNFSILVSTGTNKVESWGDGSGPVGAADAVVSYIHDDAAADNVRLVITYREE